MNLRHKKPINSYRGQANNDKNEFNDDDFKHQPSPSKKLNGSSGEQMYKYSKILAKFIMNANQYYREKAKNPKKAKTQIQNTLQEAKFTRDQSRSSKLVKRLQQPKQKRKIIPKIQNEKLQFKQQKQKQSSKLESQIKLPKEPELLPQQKNNTSNLPLKNVPSSTQIPNKIENLNKEKTPLPIPQNFLNIYGQGISMGFPNPAIYANMPINQYMGCYEEIMRISMLQHLFKHQQFKGMNLNNFSPQFLASIMTNTDLLNLKPNIYPNYMRMQSPQAPTPDKNPPLIHNLTEVFLTQKQSIFNQSKQRPNLIAKRASFHVGIAYHIYLKQLKNKNKDTSDINQIDPTRRSREIKQRQHGTKKSVKGKGKK